MTTDPHARVLAHVSRVLDNNPDCRHFEANSFFDGTPGACLDAVAWWEASDAARVRMLIELGILWEASAPPCLYPDFGAALAEVRSVGLLGIDPDALRRAAWRRRQEQIRANARKVGLNESSR